MSDLSNEPNAHLKAFYFIWFSDFVAAIGHGISSFGLAVYVFQRSGLATHVSLVMLCAFLPSVLLAPFAGVLADQFDRRLLMIIGETVSGVAMLVMAGLYFWKDLGIWHICLLVFIGSIFIGLVQPASRATITDLVPPSLYTRAGGLFQLSQAAKFLFAPAIGGLMMTYSNIALPLVIDASTAVVTVSVVTIVRRYIGKSKSGVVTRSAFATDFFVGWHFVRAHKGILLLMLLVSLITFYLGVLETLFTPLMLSIADEKTLGVVQSTAAVGMLVSSLAIGLFDKVHNHLRLLAIGLGLAGVFIGFLGTTTKIGLILAMAFCFFCTLPPVNTAAEVLMRSAVPNDIQGRVWGLLSMISQSGYLLAYATAGLLADWVFNPLLLNGGALADSIVGRFVGVGPMRGIGLLFLLSGVFIFIIAAIIPQIRAIQMLQVQAADQRDDYLSAEQNQ